MCSRALTRAELGSSRLSHTCTAERLASAGHGVGPKSLLAESDFRFGSLRARLRTDNAEFRLRFLQIFHDCLEPPSSRSDAPVVDLQVTCSTEADAVIAAISSHDASSAGAVLGKLFPELNIVSVGCDAPEGWHFFACGADAERPVIAARGNQIVIDRGMPWQIMVAHYFVAHVMRLQPKWAFFHGATVAIGDCGVLLSGNKGLGKSTLSPCAGRARPRLSR